MALFRISGDILPYTPAANTDAGTLVNIGDIVGVTQFFIEKDKEGTIKTKGVFEGVPKGTSSNALTAGQVVFYNPTDGKIYNASAPGYIPCGYALEAAGAAVETCKLWLVPSVKAAQEDEGSDSGSGS